MAKKIAVTARFADTDIEKCRGYCALQDHAKQRGIGFTLSYRRYCQLLKAKRCFYTGVELNKSPHKSPDHFTLDRIDSTGPYSDTNTVPCTGNFNIRKGNLTAEEVKLLYLAFRKKKLIV